MRLRQPSERCAAYAGTSAKAPPADFDEFAPGYVGAVDRSVAFTGRDSAFFARRKVDLLRQLARRTVGGLAASSVLDVGCGTGTTDHLLAGECRSLYGVDVSEEMLAWVGANVPGVSYRWYDGGRLPFVAGHFDVVVAICVLHHVPTPDRPAFVGELVRVTRPGGLITIFEHNPFNPLTRRAVSSCPLDEGVVLSSHRRTVELLRSAGVMAATTTHYLFSPLGGAPGSAIDRLLSGVPIGGQYVVSGSPEVVHPSRHADAGRNATATPIVRDLGA